MNAAAVDSASRPALPGTPASHWRNLDYFNLYRLLLALALSLSGLLFGELVGLKPLFSVFAFAYLAAAVVFMPGIRARRPSLPLQLSAHVLSDIVFMALLMATSERGVAYGLGLLLVISVASGGLAGSGRLTLLYAAVASLAALSQFGIGLLIRKFNINDLFQVGLVCVGYFIVGLLSHITARRARQFEQVAAEKTAALALLGRIHAAAVAQSSTGLLAVAGDGRLRHVSARAAALLRRAPPTDGARLRDWAPELADWLERGAQAELSVGDVRLRAMPMGDDAIQLISIEDRRVLDEAARRQKLAALGRLTANLAHEIRNPLSAIGHAAQLLSEDAASREQARLTGIIGNNVHRLNNLVEEVLTLNRRDRTEPKRIGAAQLAELTRELGEAEDIPPSAIRLALDGTAEFLFDPEHLRQIIWNLLRNAWRASSKMPGCLRLVLDEGAGGVRLALIDDGPGVRPEHRDRLFEPFFTTEAQGTGLGLFLARELAEANAANLEFVPGDAGAQFVLTMRKERGDAPDYPAGR